MTWIHTHTGRMLDLLDPRPEQICIEDIAHALGRIGRFTGHAHHFYSVAEHSVRCSENVDPCEFPTEKAGRVAALMHDATEAYVNDLAAPLKRLCPDYAAIEKRVWTGMIRRPLASGSAT